jgi:4-nitrophenyl phosphatase
MIKGILFDIEGTLVKDKRYQAVPGAVEFVRDRRERGLALRLITNNTTDRPEEIVRKLHAAGFDVRVEELFACTTAAIEALAARGLRRCYLIGTPPLRDMLRDAGLTLVDSSEVEAVVVGHDPALTYAMLRTATEAIVEHGALLLALHRNRVFHDDRHQLGPSAGATVAAIAYAANVEPLVAGKPSPDFYRQALVSMGLPVAQAIVVSDDPFSDLAGAKRLGLRTAFLLCGAYPDPAVLERLAPEERPDLVARDYEELARRWPE